MANLLEIQKEQAEKLYDLLMIKRENNGHVNKKLDEAIARTRAAMSKEAIAWVEQEVNSLS